MNSGWVLERRGYDTKKRGATEPIFTLGNGYMCARGFFEEEQEDILSNGGIYMAGVFGKARYKPWKGQGKELVNISNIFATNIRIDGEQVLVEEGQVEDFNLRLEMDTPKFCRCYTWISHKGKKVNIKFERFISGDDIHLAGHKVSFSTKDDIELEFEGYIDSKVKNLNMVSCEPWPIQPGVQHLDVVQHENYMVETCVREPKEIRIVHGILAESSGRIRKQLSANEKISFERVIYTYTSLESNCPLMNCKKALEQKISYEEAFARHKKAWKHKWETADIKIVGCDADQISLRYNMLQLIQSCPQHTEKQSIGARGLTGEMYEGCVFWDTEIFMVPFFTFSNPKASKNLLGFRYHTLNEAREHAKSNWFDGAMYGWQVSEDGIEQTPQGVGAYYSIHVIADISYAILEYYYTTKDNAFMVEKGAEILIETSRFWKSRVCLDTETGKYNILAVRGPNEYDVIVNNNLYTNMMTQENIRLAIKVIKMMRKDYPIQWEQLAHKVNFRLDEMIEWEKIAENILIPYNKALDLYEEDDMYLKRKPLNMAKAKPTKKRIIDTTIPYEGLMLYQVTKQADVLHVMKNLPWRFTKNQVLKAWDYYVPKTCNDSSLSYSMHSVMAAKLGKKEKAYEYFNISVNLDLRDVQLNTVSGLHFANFGGAWQAVVFGFAGISIDEERLNINPNLPEQWKEMSFKVWYQGNLLDIIITKNKVVVNVDMKMEEVIMVSIDGTEYSITNSREIAKEL